MKSFLYKDNLEDNEIKTVVDIHKEERIKQEGNVGK